MKIKKTFLIKGKEWSVDYKWGLRQDGDLLDGLCTFPDRLITLRRELSADEKASAFLHELIHAVLFEAHISSPGSMPEVIEEVVCDSVAATLLELFELRWKRKA